MKKIRIGKDISIAWRILTNGEAVSLEGRDLTLHLVDPLNRKMQIPFTVEDVLLEAKVSGTTQKFLGKYSLTLWENYGKPGQTAVDACNAFELVKTTCMEGGADEGLDTEVVDLSTSNIEIITASGEVGTNDYNNLQNKPSINNVELDGNKTLDELGIQPKGEYLTEIPSEYVTDSELTEQLEGYATKEDIPDVSGFATKEEIPDVSGLVEEAPKDGNNYVRNNGQCSQLVEVPESGAIAVDTELSDSSVNPVQNRAIAGKITELEGKINDSGNAQDSYQGRARA